MKTKMIHTSYIAILKNLFHSNPRFLRNVRAVTAYSSWVKAITILTLLVSFSGTAQSPCGLDIFVVNDQSGSVDAIENEQSREFISVMANQFNPLGTTVTDTRIAISEFAGTNTWQRYSFPIAGPTYTTDFTDVLDYQFAARTLIGATDINDGFVQAASQLHINEIAGRTNPRIVLLLTDASCGQIAPATVDAANYLRTLGYYVMVLAIDDAVPCTILSSVASPGGLITATDYQTLENDALNLIGQIATAGCSQPDFTPLYDLEITITSFTADNCSPGPGTYTTNYTVTNNGPGDFNGSLTTSFFDFDPTRPVAQYIDKDEDGVQSIAGSGGTYNGTFTATSLSAVTTLYAVVNIDGSLAVNAVPLPYQLTAAQLVESSEVETNNNFSNGFNRVNGPGCDPQAILTVNAVNAGLGCDDRTIYETTICNSGDADGLLSSFTPHAGAGFNLIDSTHDVQNLNLAVNSFQKISDTQGGFTGILDNSDFFSRGISNIGDLDGDNVTDIVVCAPFDDDGGNNRGAIYILFMNTDGTVASHQKISDTAGGFTGTLDNEDHFGWTAAGLGDLDGDNIEDIAVSIGGDDDGGTNRGAVWVLFLNADGTVKSHQKISDTAGGFGGTLADSDFFGSGVDTIGDLDDDGVVDLVVGARGDDTAGNVAGAAWIVFLNTDGTVKGQQKITEGVGGFTGDLDASDQSGSAVSKIGDLDCDGVEDIAYGSGGDDDGGSLKGAVYILFMNTDGTVKDHHKISDNDPSFTGVLTDFNFFGGSVEGIGDFDGDGIPDISVGGIIYPNLSNIEGSFYILLLNADGSVKDYQRVASGEGGFPTGQLDANDEFGNDIASLGDLNGDGVIDLVVGAARDDDGGAATFIDRGAVYVLFMEAPVPVIAPGECITYEHAYDVSGAIAGPYDFSASVTATKDQAGDADPQILPDTNFSVGAMTGLDGFDGSQHTSDDVTVAPTSACPPDLFIVSVDIPDDNLCEGDFTTATVTITNNSGLELTVTDLFLNLTGSSTFASEPYNFMGGLVLPFVDIFDPAYPAVPNALFGTNGSSTRDIYTLPDGVSSFDIDILVAVGASNLEAQISGIFKLLSGTGQSNLASDATGVTGEAAPTISGTCPSDVTIAATTLSLNYTVTGATTVQWTSNSGGAFTAPNSGTTDYTISGTDRANGYVDLSLLTETASGCQSAITCRVNITGATYDYGDAPTTYDLNQTTVLIAGASTTLAGMYLGSAAPDTEANTQPTADATGDGVDEDGFSGSLPGAIPGQTGYTFTATITNTSAVDGYATAFIDWNEDGDFLDTMERSTAVETITAGSGTQTITFTFDVPSTVPATEAFIRLRLSSDAGAIRRSYAPAPEGELEDFLATLAPIVKDYMRHGKFFSNDQEQPMEFGKSGGN